VQSYRFYEQNVSSRHLDIGVGSGLLLRHCLQLGLLGQVALMDLNQNCLDATEKALHPLPVQKYRANLLQPFPMDDQRFASIGMNFLLHCVPGSFREKGVAFNFCKDVLAPKGVVFGSTVLAQPGAFNAPGRWLMERYNRAGIFNNRHDNQEELQTLLANLFENVELNLEGSVLFFRASDGPLA
jgi:ubiquinone/menaquinone biosynthesis C-methylase UbiE